MPPSISMPRCVLLLLFGLTHEVAAQQPVVAQQPVDALSADEVAAMDSIVAANVLSTVAFLSSDELAGRQTPSSELQIASRYVACRFLGAGLEPLDDGQTYFQTHDFRVSQPPHQPPVLTTDGGTVPVLGVLSSSSDALMLTAKVMAESPALHAEHAPCVLLDELFVRPDAADKPATVLLTLFRRLRPLMEKGTQLVLVKCDPQSPLRDVAVRLQQQPLPDRPGLQPSCAVVLIPEAFDIEESTVTVQIEAQRRRSVPVRNVIAVLRGSDDVLRDDAILVTAHLDHIGTQASGADDLSTTADVDRIYNGADDNATGVTAVLALADAFAALPVAPRRSIVFMTFWGEEKGLLGSKAFVKTPLWPLDNVTANVNIEMVGRPEPGAQNKIWMTGWKHSNLGRLMNVGAQRVGVEVFDRQDVGEMLYLRSDNASFLTAGVIAHSFSAGSLHSDYHQVSDEWPKLNIAHMTKVIQGLFAGILHVANSNTGPRKN
ncbi:MAG: M28 family peptidase [Planctomycetaceae bacterium]